jgi:hypothetical protein
MKGQSIGQPSVANPTVRGGQRDHWRTPGVGHQSRGQVSHCIARYRSFVAEGIDAPCPWSALKNQIYLGSGAFVAKLQRLIDPERPLDDVPKRQRRPVAKPLEHFRVHYKDRDRALAEHTKQACTAWRRSLNIVA